MTNDTIAVTHRGKEVRFEPFGGSVEKKLRTNQFYEGEMLQYIEALGLGGAYVDVGAYVGTHTLFLASYCPADRVHAFEPRTGCFERLRRNVELNALGDRIALHRLGLSDREESVDITFEGPTESVQCRPLDDVVHGPVSVMKIDVEGMEEKVLGGADRILRESKPLLFIEAHTAAELERDLAILAPYGYRTTGRVFNASATYEFAAPDSPTAPPARLPKARPLLDPALWRPDGEGLHVEFSGGMRLRAAALGDRKVHLTQEAPGNLRRPPVGDPIPVTQDATWFLETDGTFDPTIELAVFAMEYDERERTVVHRLHFHARSFQPIVLRPETRRLRIALRVGGTGSVEVQRLALHGVPRV